MPNCLACATPMWPRFRSQTPHHWRCPDCGLECISPQPDDQTLAAIYDRSYFSHYQTEARCSVVREMKRSTYANQLRILPSPNLTARLPRLLDCGAATGFLVELAKERGWDAFAVEVSSFGSRACMQLLGTDRVYCGQLEEASFPANPQGSFDVITMFDFIEHVRDPRRTFESARDRLSEGGVLLLTTPRAGSLSWRLMGRQWFHYVQEHLWFFTAKSIRILLKKSGFRTIEVRCLLKAVTLGYALAYYARRTSQNPLFTPLARLLDAHSREKLKQLRLWCYLGEMAVLARV